MFIPAKALNGYDPVHHPQIAFNFHARNYQHAAEYYWSAPKQVLTQARPNTWGLVFLDPPAGSPGNQSLPIAGTQNEIAK